MLWYSVALLAFFASAQGRAVNISNTWVLPEEGFPVFYRYFRDRISWYEADAVCQFHHANLVTVDTTAQYDAVRAYLKELDISSAVWVGLIRSNPDGDFTWTDYRGLSSEGYWSSAPDTRAAPLCAAADPAADYRWEARACGGPTVASFICELPVPQWALGNEGCMVRALPALTILYLPESAAVQLTADCGLAGVKRVQCIGNVKREDLLRDLSCSEEEEATTTVNITSSSNTWPATTDVIFTDQDTTAETTSDQNGTTEHEDDINQTSTTMPPTSTSDIKTVTDNIPIKVNNINKFNRIHNILDKNLDLALVHNNNLQSNYIPKIANADNYLSNEKHDKMEEEKHMQHKMIHEEIARRGNLENIFTQPTDHFVPPLVMAKAKLSNDMTVLSLEEKHAQQLAEQHLSKQNIQYRQNDHTPISSIVKSTTEEPEEVSADELIPGTISKDNIKKDKTKTSMPKKYNEKMYDLKNKVQKSVEIKPVTLDKTREPVFTTPETINKHIEVTTLPLVGRLEDDDESSLDLTIFLKDRPENHEEKQFYNYSGDVSRLEVVKNITLDNDTEVKLLDVEATEEAKYEISSKGFEEKIQNITVNHEVVKITIISEGHSTAPPTVFEITTKSHLLHDVSSTNPLSTTTNNVEDYSLTTTSKSERNDVQITFEADTTGNVSSNASVSELQNVTTAPVVTDPTNLSNITRTTELPIVKITTTLDIKNMSVGDNITKDTVTTTGNPYIIHEDDVTIITTDAHEEYGINYNSSDIVGDFNSPLLSAANEPVRRPNRSRRPQQPNRNKFNPFRILG